MDRLTRQIFMAAAAGGTAAFSPVTNTYNAVSGTETIPAGAAVLVIEIWGGGSGGGRGSELFDAIEGGGGGGAGYSKKTLALTAADWGKTLTYVAGPGGARGIAGLPDGQPGQNSSVNNGTLAAAVAMAANAGTGGARGATGGAQGNGGTASGGDINTSGEGTNLVASSVGGSSANGGAAQATQGAAGNAPGGGGGGGDIGPGDGGNGAAGRAKFSYT